MRDVMASVALFFSNTNFQNTNKIMIKTNELRIGNLVFLNDKQKVWEIMDGFDIDEMTENSTVDPIPITEDWLLKAGFEKDDTGVDMFDQDYYEWYQKEFPIIGVLCQSSDKSYLFDENTDTIRIKYVHQLQNLHFAICGEELVFSSTEP